MGFSLHFAFLAVHSPEMGWVVSLQPWKVLPVALGVLCRSEGSRRHSSVLWGVEAPCGLSDDGFSLHAGSSSWGALRHFP